MKKFLKELIPYVIIVIVVVLIRTFVITPFIVDGVSMNPTLVDRQVMILNKLAKTPSRYDIIVLTVEEERLVKRVIGLPGETIRCDEGVIYINDKPLKDEYGSGHTFNFPAEKLKDDEYYVLGDNREDSKDSRYFGPVNKDEIVGKTSLRLWPLSKFGFTK